MGRTRESANLVSDKNIFVDIANDLVGIGTTAPTATLEVSGTLAVSGVSTFQGNVDLGDNDRLRIGDGNDLQIHHNNSNSLIDHDGTGNLYVQTSGSGEDLYLQAADNVLIRPQGGENGIKVIGNAAVELYYDNSKKLETSGGGVTVTGVATATSFSGDGSNLTNVPTGFSPINFVLS